jgi:GT2 family glycosyltransferase
VLRELPRNVPLLVIDQSEDARTERVVHCLATNGARVEYVRQSARGISRARNAALNLAASFGLEFVLFTDDDCTVGPGWFGSMMGPFADSTVALVFGNVDPAQDDDADGFIVGFHAAQARSLRGRLAKLLDAGIGASMAVRTNAAQAVGSFDELLGPGASFPSCEEGDFAYRVLKAGYTLCHAPEAVVDHHGLRAWEDGSRLTQSTYYGVGAAYAKHLKEGDLMALVLLGHQLALCSREICVNVVRLRAPVGFRRPLSLFKGVVGAFRTPVAGGKFQPNRS